MEKSISEARLFRQAAFDTSTRRAEFVKHYHFVINKLFQDYRKPRGRQVFVTRPGQRLEESPDAPKLQSES